MYIKSQFSSPAPAFQTQVPKLHTYTCSTGNHEIPKEKHSYICGTYMNAARLLINHSLRDRKENKESYLKEFLGLVALKIELQSNSEKFAKQKDLLFQATNCVVF